MIMNHGNQQNLYLVLRALTCHQLTMNNSCHAVYGSFNCIIISITPGISYKIWPLVKWYGCLNQKKNDWKYSVWLENLSWFLVQIQIFSSFIVHVFVHVVCNFTIFKIFILNLEKTKNINVYSLLSLLTYGKMVLYGDVYVVCQKKKSTKYLLVMKPVNFD